MDKHNGQTSPSVEVDVGKYASRVRKENFLRFGEIVFCIALLKVIRKYCSPLHF